MSEEESKQGGEVVNTLHADKQPADADPPHAGLSESARERFSSMETAGCTIDVVEVSYSVQVEGTTKRLLKNCSFSLAPGELCALMGPSGAGKSTLLDLVADRKKIGAWHGEVYIDKKPRNRLFPKNIAYVLQDDVHIATLTVEETLMYAAWTRMPEGTTFEARKQRVDDLLNVMGLSHVKQSIIGDPMKKGISGGQQKRLSIAVEIIHMPSIIFLDEPTSGLDSSISLEVMTSVRQLTEQRRTCISTIHQPSPEVYDLFDKLVLLSAGRVIYFGPAKEAPDYFRSTGYHYDGLRNPAEFIIEVSCGQLLPEGEKEPRQPEVLEMEYRASKYCARPSVVSKTIADQADIDAENEKIAHMRLHATSKLTQFKMLSHRTWFSKIRDYDDMKAQLGKNVIVGLLIGILFRTQGDVDTPFYDHGVVDGSVTNCCSILFMTMMFTMVGNSQAIPYISAQILVYRRELASNAYGTFPFWLSAVLTNLPITFVFHFLFIISFYFLVELPNNGHYFFFFLFLTWFGSLTAYFAAMALAALVNDDELAFILFPLQFLLFVMFSGYPINMNDLPDYYIWGPYISYTRYVFEGLMVNQWSQFDDDDLSSGYDQNGNGNILALYDFTGFEANWAFGLVLIFVFLFAMLTYVFLKPKPNRLVRVEKTTDLMSAASVARGPSLIGRGPSLYGAAKSGVDAVLRGASVGGVVRTKSRGRNSNDLGVSLVGKADYGDEDDIIDTDEELKPEPKLTVDFYRASTGIVDAAQGCRLVFRNINYTVTSKADGKTQVKLLTDVTGRANPGEMVALMGASGAGKSTLLDVIAQRKNTGKIDGSITYNGSKIMKSFAYVMQDNVYIGMLTVRETLYYASELRLSQFMSKEDKEKRIDKIINMLGLQKQADTILGTHTIRGISGGQLKRVMIGVEIVQLPDLMFLDEPTTGLDSSIALEVMSAVRNLANQNRTVICTIHQPSPDTFALFDSLLLLAAGRVIYFGAVSSMISYFQDSPYKFHYKEGSNPADYVVAVAGGFINASDGNTISGAELADYYTTTDKFQAAQEMFPAAGQNKGTASGVPGSMQTAGTSGKEEQGEEEEVEPFKYNTTTLYQLQTLVSRKLLLVKKDPPSIIVTLVRNVVVAAFYGSIYYDLDTGTDVSDYTNRFSIIFFSLMFFLVKDMQAIPMLMGSRLVFYRERGAKAYGALTYWISSWFIQVPLQLVSVLLYSAVLYPMVDFRHGQHHFNWFYYFLMMQSVIGVFIGIAIAAMAPSSQAALSLFPVLLFWQVGFAGYLVYIPQFDDYLRAWAPYAVWMRYAFQGLVMNELQHNDDLPNYQLYLNDLGFDNSFSVKGCAGILPIFLGTAMLLSLLALKYIDWEER